MFLVIKKTRKTHEYTIPIHIRPRPKAWEFMGISGILSQIGYFLLFFHNSNGQQNSPTVEFLLEKIEGSLRWGDTKLSKKLKRANRNRLCIWEGQYGTVYAF